MALRTGGSALRLGFDVGGTKVALALGDEAGGVLGRQRIAFPGTGRPRDDVGQMLEAARALLAKHGATFADLAGVGLALPGPMDAEAGRVLSPPNLPGWHDVAVADWVAEATGAPVATENDADAAALAEWRHGAARGAEHAVFLTMSTGVGAGLVLGGRVHRGRAGAGEVGHAPVEWEGEACACGLRGCLEAYVGGAAWARRLRRLAPDGGRVVELAGSKGAVTPEHLVAAAGEGDPFALAELERWNTYLARGIAWIEMALSPDVVVLGTIARAAADLCLGPVRRLVAEQTWGLGGGPRIVAGELGDDLPDRAALAVAEFAVERAAAS
ncbi:MAG: ROK family protein [Deltaproteobacteria bacterium]|nr:ROK family protein [Deltaproteobacteria bacterium]